jgi:hypothetical protein
VKLKRLPQYPEPPFVAVNGAEQTCIVLGVESDAGELMVYFIPTHPRMLDVIDMMASSFKKHFTAADFDVKKAAEKYLQMSNLKVSSAAKAALLSIKEGTYMKKQAKKISKAAAKGETAKAPKAVKEAKGGKSKGAAKAGPGRKSNIPENGKIVMIAKANPFRSGTWVHGRFEMAKKAGSIPAYRKAGGSGNGFLNGAIRKGLLKVVG